MIFLLDDEGDCHHIDDIEAAEAAQSIGDDTMKQTPYQHALSNLKAGKFTNLWVEKLNDECFMLVDDEFRFLKGKGYPSRAAAENDRSKIVDRALKAWSRA